MERVGAEGGSKEAEGAKGMRIEREGEGVEGAKGKE